MPIDYTKYPADWKTVIRPRILQREDNRCKWCQRANGEHLPAKCCREPIFDDRHRCRSCGKPRPKVVLTIAHLDHDITHNADDNLAALCQKCHLTYDARLHADNARRTRERRSGQLVLL